jgi:hypothetical protein
MQQNFREWREFNAKFCVIDDNCNIDFAWLSKIAMKFTSFTRMTAITLVFKIWSNIIDEFIHNLSSMKKIGMNSSSFTRIKQNLRQWRIFKAKFYVIDEYQSENLRQLQKWEIATLLKDGIKLSDGLIDESLIFVINVKLSLRRWQLHERSRYCLVIIVQYCRDDDLTIWWLIIAPGGWS